MHGVLEGWMSDARRVPFIRMRVTQCDNRVGCESLDQIEEKETRKQGEEMHLR